MNRKHFLRSTAAFALMTTSSGLVKGYSNFKPESSNKSSGAIQTVTGAIPAEKMGLALIHEHVLSIFTTDPQEPAQYDNSKALGEVVPYLKYIKSLGCDTVVECSAAYLGRNAALLEQISEQSGMQIIASTGIYGAADDRYVPEYAYEETAEQLASRWVEEFNQGIQGTDVKPGFLKSGVDGGSLSDIDAKLVRAAALTHSETGLLLQIHTANNPKAVDQQLDILKKEGVSPQAWAWVHAQSVPEPGPLIRAAKRGAWISLDGLRTPNFLNGKREGDSTLSHHFGLLSALKKAGLLNRVLLSHDGSSFPPKGVAKRPFDVLMNTFIPMMQAGGFTEAEINQLTRKNPAEAFAIEVRKI